MTPWLDDGDIRLYHGDALETVRGLPDESVDCVVTSPPVREGERGGRTNPATVPTKAKTVGWSDCGHNNWRPGTVLDPFIGSGTTAKVARDHQRHAIGIDLSSEYLELAARRLQQLSLLTGGTNP